MENQKDKKWNRKEIWINSHVLGGGVIVDVAGMKY